MVWLKERVYLAQSNGQSEGKEEVQAAGCPIIYSSLLTRTRDTMARLQGNINSFGLKIAVHSTHATCTNLHVDRHDPGTSAPGARPFS